MKAKQVIVILVHAIVGWALCGAIIGVGFAVTSEQTAVIVHAIGVPIVFSALSLLYFGKFNYTAPLQTAAIWTLFAILMDFFIIALLVNKSLAMFTSVLGTWIPFALIFASTYLVGTWVRSRKAR